MRRLILNADDFGYNEGAVRGIVDCHQAGVISSTSCMTNRPAWPQAAAYLRAHPELGAGVHLVFNDGYPVLPPEQVPALVRRDGRFLTDPEIRRSLRRGTTAQLRAELRAQIGRFFNDVGRPPTHLDNHCKVSYLRPDRFRVTLELAKEFGLPIRAPFGDDLAERAAELSHINRLPAWLIRIQGASYRKRIDRHGIPRPNTFLMDFTRPGGRNVDNLIRVLRSVRDGWISELVTHPGYDGDWRETEVQVLLDPRVRACLDELAIELVNFGVLSDGEGTGRT